MSVSSWVTGLVAALGFGGPAVPLYNGYLEAD